MRSGDYAPIDVHLETGAENLDFASGWSAIWPHHSEELRRGPVRLVVVMPWGSANRLVLRISTAITCVVVSAMMYFLGRGNPVEAVRAYAVLAVVVCAFAWNAWRSRAWTERLEIDSKYVTVSVGDQQWVWSRSQFADVRLSPDPPARVARRALKRGLWPTIVWGTNAADPATGYVSGIGSGISRQAAANLLERITEFCTRVPEQSAASESRRLRPAESA